MKKGLKRAALVTLTLSMAVLCVGCTGEQWEMMKQEGKDLLEQGAELNEQLADKAKEVNEKFSGESVLEEVQRENQNEEK